MRAAGVQASSRHSTRRTILALAAALAGTVPAAAGAQDATTVSHAARPFAPGERLIYAVKVGPLGRGRAIAEVRSATTLRGQPVYHTVFTIDGSLLFFGVDDTYQSWFNPVTLESLRYYQDIDQGPYERTRRYEIFPGDVYRDGEQEKPTVEEPLDDASFLYFLRTIPLEVGRTYSFNRYFKPDRNPVTVTVARRERIRVPAGEFDAVVLQPKIKAKGIFAESANAEVWIQDGGERLLLALRTRLPFGSVSFDLVGRETGTTAAR